MRRSDASSFRFLYREAEGVIDGSTWLRATAAPVILALVMTIVAVLIAPDQPRDLANEAFFDPLVIAVHAYDIVYAFVLLMCAVAEYFVSAKRFTDRGKPAALAGLLPFSLLLAGAAHWYQPRSEGWSPLWLPYIFDAIAIAVIAWNILELGFGASRRKPV